MNQGPSTFIIDRIKAGVSQNEIKQNLMTVGWSEESADSAILTALLAMGVPPPQQGALVEAKKSASTLDVVLNFFSFILLGLVASSLGMLYYGIINTYFPDPALSMYGYDAGTSGMTYAMASLLVAFPLYVVVVRMWFRRFRENTERMESKLTKWLTYLVLLSTSLAIVIDLITAIFYMLEGDLTVRFLLKALTILVIAGTIFAFYVLERRLVQYGAMVARQSFQLIGVGVSVLVLAGLGLGFSAVGSPGEAREVNIDQVRAQALQSISGCITQFAQARGRFPTELEELQSSSQYSYCGSDTSDPVTYVPYEYIPGELALSETGYMEGTFELCATFDRASADAPRSSTGMYQKWGTHSAGRDCDKETVSFVPVASLPVK